MKPLIVKWVALVTILISSTARCAVSPHGLILYTEPPATYAESLEYYSLTETSVVFATAVLPNGKKQEIARAGILAIIPYPPESLTVSLPDAAAAASKTIQTALAKYPQFTAKLDAAQTRWANSLEVFRQRERMMTATPPKPTQTFTLTVDGITYTQVVLTSFDGADVGIEHSAGAARIPAIKLKPEQIIALNATSLSVRIDPSKIIAELPKASPAPQPLTAATKAPAKLPFPEVPGIPLTPAQQAANDAVREQQQRADEAAAKEKIRSLLSDQQVLWPRGLDFQNINPDYRETLEFINGKIKDAGQRMWYGEKTGEMILQSPDYVDTFDPKTLSTTVKMGHGSDGMPFVQAECPDGRRDVFSVWRWGPSGQGPGIRLHCADDLDLKRVAEAMLHLIIMFGGKKEAF